MSLNYHFIIKEVMKKKTINLIIEIVKAIVFAIAGYFGGSAI